MSVVGGLVWGAIAAFSGYVFALAAIVLGLLIAAVVRRGAGTVTWGVIGLAVVLTLFAVFLGDVIGITIAAIQAGYRVSVIDVLAAYPELLALAPGQAAVAYLFGFLGAAYGGWRLYRDMRGASRAKPMSGFASSRPTASPPVAGDVTVHTLLRSATTARARITVAGPPAHVIEASYETTFGSAKVQLDGQPFQKTRVWGRQKTIEVALPGSPGHAVSLRFYGIPSPKIDVSVGGELVATV